MENSSPVNLVDIFSILFAAFALVISWRAHEKTKEDSKNTFLNNFRDKLKSAKYEILSFESRDYSNNEKIILTEKIRDYLLYQGYKDEKRKYLDKSIQKDLFRLQEDIEDYVSLILANKDFDTNVDLVKNLLNEFFKKI
ncbi:MAG: hypothetical protein LGB71_02625 [Sulfurovum sp.]|nr:hypothetical protein [Sulfurovum sp.]MCB4774171.1 hypothetical protein [Sulfurovum sp.]MCB4777351.1 hypothetical protein [Sulfurovum sp.]